MSPLPRSIVERLADFESAVFESALVEFGNAVSGDTDGACAEILSCCRALADAHVLDSTERRRRVSLILSRISLADPLSRELAKAAGQFPGEIRNAIANAVPAKFKGLTYGRAEYIEFVPADKADYSGPVVAARPATAEEPHQGLVLLLGSAKDHEHNVRILNNSCNVNPTEIKFVGERASSIDDFRRMLNDEVCAIVVAKSWWNNLPAHEHPKLLDELLSFSSFVWLKINTDGLSVQDVFDRFNHIRCRVSRATELQASSSHDITEAELSLLYVSAGFSQDARHARLYPGEILPRDARLIVSSAKAYVQDRNSTDRGKLREVSARILQGGRSGTILVHVSAEHRTLPFVAKIGELERLREEMTRFHTFIAHFDSQLRPELHFHQTRAAIIFGLVANADDDFEPAPTLCNILEDLLLSECGGSDIGASEEELSKLIGRVIEKLRRLNAERPCSNEISSCMWTNLDPLKKMEDAGISWNLLPLSDGTCPLEACADADKCLQSFNDVSVVHGDIHLLNILVRDHREPHLIDYAYAGPGHPCFDLVRLESALLFHAFRMTDREETVRELLIAIGRGSVFGEVKEKFPTLFSSIGNRLAINASIRARQACLELLRVHNGDESQYHAMKLVVSCQSLAIPDCQTGVVRASISAAAETFLERSQLEEVTAGSSAAAR